MDRGHLQFCPKQLEKPWEGIKQGHDRIHCGLYRLTLATWNALEQVGLASQRELPRPGWREPWTSLRAATVGLHAVLNRPRRGRETGRRPCHLLFISLSAKIPPK